MTHSKELFAAIAAVLALIGNVPYSYSIVRGGVKPHAYTWFVWSVVSGIVLAGQIEKGAGVGAAPTAVSELFTFANFVLCLRHGYRKVTLVDTLFLLVALLGIVTWLVIDDPTLAVILAVGIDIVAFIPTLRKTWMEPATERVGLYAMNVARHVLALFALEVYNLATTLHSIAMLVLNSLMTGLLIHRKGGDDPVSRTALREGSVSSHTEGAGGE